MNLRFKKHSLMAIWKQENWAGSCCISLGKGDETLSHGNGNEKAAETLETEEQNHKASSS